tara:strand:- start:316 stop:603 length:288 start_codon:yes stop_codon:yes gene_type:complete
MCREVPPYDEMLVYNIGLKQSLKPRGIKAAINVHHIRTMIWHYKLAHEMLTNYQDVIDFDEQLDLFERTGQVLREFLVHSDIKKAMKKNGCWHQK